MRIRLHCRHLTDSQLYGRVPQQLKTAAQPVSQPQSQARRQKHKTRHQGNRFFQSRLRCACKITFRCSDDQAPTQTNALPKRLKRHNQGIIPCARTFDKADPLLRPAQVGAGTGTEGLI